MTTLNPDLAAAADHVPLAERMRPRCLDEVVGQAHLLAEGRPLRRAIHADRPHSLIFWGPPGTGKTTLARVIAQATNSQFLSLSAVLAGVKDIRAAVEQAKRIRASEQRGTILFIDEVHRFNKAQQDAFLPHVEDGTLVFIGATTENPSFALNNALLSRARVYVLQPLEVDDLERLVDRALADAERGLACGLNTGQDLAVDLDTVLAIDADARTLLAQAADGDARRLLNLLELAADLAADPAADTAQETPRAGATFTRDRRSEPPKTDSPGEQSPRPPETDAGVVDVAGGSGADTDPRSAPTRRSVPSVAEGVEVTEDAAGQGVRRIAIEQVRQVIEGSFRRFDKAGDVFYDQISALHKSVRGSAPDAALYWLARMIDGGCDPLYIARRLVRMASEDIGNADPRALTLALNAWDAQLRLGSPEGELALAQAVAYLAVAAKSNAVYRAWNAALEDARQQGSLEVPVHLRNAPTRLMKELGYGKAYRYAHDEPDAYAAGEQYFPDGMPPRSYYQPVERGMEIRIKEKLARLAALDRQRQGETNR